jgi:1-deoxy-D-xylulose-5-phosphate reductoisomerase
VKAISILGSTGSVGTQTLAVVERFPEQLRVAGLAAGRNLDLLIQQAKQFRPELISVERSEDVARVRAALDDPRVEVCSDPNVVARADADLVVGALVGSIGMQPVLAALRAGHDVALANKEVLVMAGELVLAEARRHGASLIPLDSEHVAIHQCLAGHPREAVRRVTLTASGGPFRTVTERSALERVTPEQALAHPNWDMGPKITIDSATLMNKGFEVIEARWLFELEPEEIAVVIHPESIVHSLVEFRDGSWLAQLAVPDMRVPIAYALALPERLDLAEDLEPLELTELGALHFEAPDSRLFPALGLAREAMIEGGTAPAVLSAANEVAVAAFLERRIPFTAIVEAAEAVLEGQSAQPARDLDTILEADREARVRAGHWIEERSA